MNIITLPNKVAASKKALEIITDTLREGNEVFGLSTGETPKILYELICKSPLDFSQSTAVNLDEFYGIKAEQEQSYHHYMDKHLFYKKKFKQSFIPNGENYNVLDEIERFDRILEEHPRDLQLLGLGINGHIGFNEPGESFELRTHLTRLSTVTLGTYQNYFKALEDAPQYAYSMGIKSILEAKHIVLMAFGAHKAKAVKDMVEGPVNRNVPASVLQQHKKTTILLDREAGRLLFNRE